MEGWIKINRKMLRWEWADNPNTGWLFITLLMLANHDDSTWKGIEIKRGQLITARAKLSAQTGLSEQSVRTALKNLQSTNEITIESTNNYSIITICKYNVYQLDEEKSNQQINQQPNQPTNQPTNHKQEDKNIIYNSSPSVVAPTCAREMIGIEEIPAYIQSLQGTQQYESIQREMLRLTGTLATAEELEGYISIFIDELHIQGAETHETKDICRHFVQWARIAIPKINRNNDKNNEEARANRSSDSRESIIASYKRSIIKDLQESGSFTNL